MAANLQSRGLLVSFGKRFVTQIGSRESASLRKSVHVSAYDKNLDDHTHSSVVPDEVINAQPDKYWSPHPKTGVFGPAADQNSASGKDFNLNASGESVLEQKAFFRPLEDLEKPQHP